MSFAQDCCTAEQNALQQAQQQMEAADAARTSARNALNDAKKPEEAALSNANIAKDVYLAAFQQVSIDSSNSDKQLAASKAYYDMLGAIDKLNAAKASREQAEDAFLKACNSYSASKVAYDSANQSLQACLGSNPKDCLGVCGGDAVEDCAGVCNGTAVVDCAGVCGGTAVLDCAGVCNGGATPGPCQKCEGGAAVADNSESCDDFDPCTAGDHCSGGGCVGTPIINPSPSSPECQ